LVTSVRGIALEPTTDASGPLGVIAFMKAAFGLRFLPAFFAFFFAISISPLDETVWTAVEISLNFYVKFAPGSPATGQR
jgi:hypothetical protein